MLYQEYEIAIPLKPFVKVIWSMESSGTAVGIPPMRILPDSCVELVIHFHDPYSTTFGSGKTDPQPKSMIVAQMKDYIEISPTGRIGMVSVRFSAQGAYHFFGVPMKEIANGVTDLKLVWNNLAHEIEERIYGCINTVERVRILQTYLIGQLLKNGQEDRIVDYCLELIYNSKGLVSIADLSVKTGTSNRQLIRKFNNRIGVSPKEFARIIKFISAVNYLRTNTSSGFAEAALDCGYYDQAHFIRDFKEYSGLTPGEFLTTDMNVVL
jgi:AraC-like DNA-binding protein